MSPTWSASPPSLPGPRAMSSQSCTSAPSRPPAAEPAGVGGGERGEDQRAADVGVVVGSTARRDCAGSRPGPRPRRAPAAEGAGAGDRGEAPGTPGAASWPGSGGRAAAVLSRRDRCGRTCSERQERGEGEAGQRSGGRSGASKGQQAQARVEARSDGGRSPRTGPGRGCPKGQQAREAGAGARAARGALAGRGLLSVRTGSSGHVLMRAVLRPAWRGAGGGRAGSMSAVPRVRFRRAEDLARSGPRTRWRSGGAWPGSVWGRSSTSSIRRRGMPGSLAAEQGAGARHLGLHPGACRLPENGVSPTRASNSITPMA